MLPVFLAAVDFFSRALEERLFAQEPEADLRWRTVTMFHNVETGELIDLAVPQGYEVLILFFELLFISP